MRIVFFISGIITMLIFGGIIVCEIENANFADEHPFITLFGGAPTPDVGFYTYKPPFTGHELIMMTGTGAGVLLLLAGIFKPSKK